LFVGLVWWSRQGQFIMLSFGLLFLLKLRDDVTGVEDSIDGKEQ
jgi:hypothetical protein